MMLDSLLAGVSALALLPFLPRVFSSDSSYRIQRSLRFRGSNSAYLTRTPTNAGTGAGRTWTWSGWVKRGVVASSGIISLMDARTSGGSADRGGFGFYTYSGGGVGSDCLTLYHGGAYANNITTTAVFRDPTAWYHIVVAVDTTQATASNRVKFYVNGSLITSFSAANYPAQNYQFALGQNIQTWFACESGSLYFFDGYLAEVHFIDGQALDASSFGQVDSTTGAWSPKAYAGAYGTNGFRLDFSDNSAATAAAIGADRSGNGNNWTPSGVSVAAGVTNDSVVDSPTNYGSDTGAGGEVRGNYCTLNPLDAGSASNLLDANLRTTAGSGGWQSRIGTTPVDSGKWYWEATVLTEGGLGVMVGISAIPTPSTFFGSASSGYGYQSNAAQKWNNNSGVAYGATFTTNDVIGVAFDRDAGTLTFYKNNVSQGVAFTGLTSGVFYPAAATYNTAGIYMNFGQRAFAYQAPSGFKALCTQNLPDPSIAKPAQFFDVATYTGNGGTRQITGMGFQPDLQWNKSRTSASWNYLIDSIRGTTKGLSSNVTDAEFNLGNTHTFNADGFTTVGPESALNANAQNYVSWLWKKGVAPGFDIVAFTATAGGSSTVAHALGVTPAFVVLKRRASAGNWVTWVKGFTTNDYLYLNGTDAKLNYAPLPIWGAGHTSSVLGYNPSVLSGAGEPWIAYVWAEVPGFSRCGSYTGNGSADGPFVWCGFRPAFVMIKRIDAANNWHIHDLRRGQNTVQQTLFPNLTDVEAASSDQIDLLANGFKIRSAGGEKNVSGGSYIFAAFAESPFKSARAR